MSKIEIKIIEQIFEPDSTPWLSANVSIDHYEEISEGEKYVLDKLIPMIKDTIKEYEKKY